MMDHRPINRAEIAAIRRAYRYLAEGDILMAMDELYAEFSSQCDLVTPITERTKVDAIRAGNERAVA